MAKKNEVTVEDKLRALFDLQLIDSRVDEIRNVRGARYCTCKCSRLTFRCCEGKSVPSIRKLGITYGNVRGAR